MRLLSLLFVLILSSPCTVHSFSSNMPTTLKSLQPSEVQLELKDPVDPTALQQAKAIINDILTESKQSVEETKLLNVAQKFGDVPKDATSVLISKETCQQAFDSLEKQEQTSLQNIHKRVQAFAQMQRSSIQNREMDIPGGKAGHTVSACQAAGCYAPGGRYPLPSSVIMTAVTARAAGCDTVVLCSPKPAKITMAAAHLCGVDYMLSLGGAQAIGTMAYGCSIGDNISLPQCDVICGPGNQWVTAAKSIVQGKCGIDMLAGPSEVLVICDHTASPQIVAADLIAQAEHDVVARAIVLGTSQETLEKVDDEVAKQLQALPEPNQSTAKAALEQSFSVLCDSMEQCIQISDSIAPEHLEIQTKDSSSVANQCRNYGGLFVGTHAAEVLGDYGAGPNHTLPTGGTGRYTGGLSVFNFLRIQTWMRVDEPAQSQGMVQDAIVLARCEGLEGHARAAEARLIQENGENGNNSNKKQKTEE